jgi:endonuclease/exonuclease/phosphatase family protein
MTDRHATVSRRTFGRLAGATALTGAAAATTATAARAASSTFRVATANIYSGLSDADFLHDLRAVGERAELIGLQEVHDRGALIREWASANGYQAWIPDAAWAKEPTVLAKRSEFQRLEQDAIFVCDSAGEGTPPPPRWIVWAKYRHLPSGRNLVHVNTHPNSHIDDAGHPYDLPRTRDAEDHFARILQLVRNKAGEAQVVVTGDFNVDYVDDKRVQYGKFPYTVLEERQGALPGLRSSYSRVGLPTLGTHGNRRIDYVYAWVRTPETRVMDLEEHYVLTGQKSDHDALVARVRMQH